MSTILLIEIVIILTITSTARGIRSNKFFQLAFNLPTEVDQQVLDCTDICPVAVNGTIRNLTLAKNSQNFTTLETPTSVTDIADACRRYVPISQTGFFTLAIIVEVLALYTILESIIMLCNICENCQIRTPSDRLLFDQGDLPDKVINKLQFLTTN